MTVDGLILDTGAPLQSGSFYGKYVTKPVKSSATDCDSSLIPKEPTWDHQAMPKILNGKKHMTLRSSYHQKSSSVGAGTELEETNHTDSGEMASAAVETNCDNPLGWIKLNRDQTIMERHDSRKHMTLRCAPQSQPTILNHAEDAVSQHPDLVQDKVSLDNKKDKSSKIRSLTKHLKMKQKDPVEVKESEQTPFADVSSNGTKRKTEEDVPETLIVSIKKKKLEKADIETSPQEKVCPICSEKFNDSHSFTLHIREHNVNTHTCQICFKKLSSASSLDRHMYVHSGERPFKCTICNIAFTTNGNMHRHVRIHMVKDEQKAKGEAKVLKKSEAQKKKLSSVVQSADQNSTDAGVDEEGTSPVEDDQLEIVEDTPEEPDVNCPVCGKGFFSEQNLQEHMETHPNDPIKCPRCDIVSEDYISHEKHDCGVSNKDNSVAEPEQDKSVVGFHDLTFVEFSSPKFSLIAKSLCESQSRRPSSAFLAFECHTCGKAFPCGRTLQQHEIVHNDKTGTFCHSCKCDFPTPEDLQAHKLKHRAAEHCKSTNHADSAEGIRGQRKEDFFAVLELFGNRGKPKTNTSNDDNNNKTEVFENMDYFVYSKTPPAVKNECLGETSNDFADISSIISLTSKTPLMPDMRASPVTASPASPVKGVTTPTPNSPLIEESARTSSETPSKEGSSNAASKDEDSNNENADDSTNLDESFPCKDCDSCFSSSNALRRHSRVHNQSSTTYSCSVCSYQSADKSTLMRHLRTHNGERPFLCKLCNYAFTTKANAQRHVRKKHQVSAEEINNVIQYNPDMSELKNPENLPADIGGSETVCKYCNKDFKYNRVLRHHLRSLNNSCSRKPYSCGACKLGFSTKNNCIRHVSNQHPDLKDKLKELVVANTTSDLSDPEYQQNSNESLSVNTGNDAHIEPLNLTLSESTEGSLCLDLSSDAYLSSDAEKVSIAQSLVSLSEVPPPQEKPLDLTMSALDLSMKPEPCCIQSKNQSESATVPRTSFEGCVPSSNTQHAYLSPSTLLRSPIPIRSPIKSGIFINSSSPLSAVSISEPVNLIKGAFLPINFVRDVSVEKQSSLLTAVPRSPQMSIPEAESPVKCLNAGEECSSWDRPQSQHSSNSVQNGLSSSPQNGPTGSSTIPNGPSNCVQGGSNENCRVQFKLVKNKLTHNSRPFTCNHCSAEFTLKSNKERHIKRKHPEFARPTRSRNFIPTLSPTNLQKQSASTLSNKTRDALRTVLSSKVQSLMQKPENQSSKSLETSPSFSHFGHSPEKLKTNLLPHFSEDAAVTVRNDGDNADLASVSAVIDTANSPVFKKYLTEAKKESDDEKSEDRTEHEFLEPNIVEPVVPLSSDDDSPGKKSSYTNSSKTVICCFCNRQFPWRSSLRRHILTHTGQKPYRCPKCPINFTTKSNRDRHLFRKHRGMDALSRNVPDRKYKCRLCPNSSFSTQAKLKKHNYVRHKVKVGSGKLLKSSEVNAESVCDPAAEASSVDNQEFDVKQDKIYSKEVLISKISPLHLNTQEKSPVWCKSESDLIHKDKDSSFQASSNLLLNCVVKEDTSEKCNNKKVNVVKCCFCLKAIESHELLLTHVKQHTAEFPYSCKLCGQVFTKMESMLFHQRWHLEEQAAGQNGESSPQSLKNDVQKQKCQNSVWYLFTTQHPAPSKLSSDSMRSSQSPHLLPNGNPLVRQDQSDSDDLIQNLLGIKDPKYVDNMIGCAAAAKLLQSKKT